MAVKNQITKDAAKASKVRYDQANRVINQFLIGIKRELTTTGKVRIQGFGTIHVMIVNMGSRKHPRTGLVIEGLQAVRIRLSPSGPFSKQIKEAHQQCRQTKGTSTTSE